VRFRILASIGLLSLAFLSGCASHKQARVQVPPPPPAESTTPPVAGDREQPAATASGHPSHPSKETGKDKVEEILTIPADAVPLSTETGLASWYGAPYHNRRGSNGEVYNMNAMTAAHRTLPLGSIVRVTNVKTGHAALVRITDRGPFVEGRILDVSYAAAKQLDIWQPVWPASSWRLCRRQRRQRRAADGPCRSVLSENRKMRRKWLSTSRGATAQPR
jgi:rare lipoprotein A